MTKEDWDKVQENLNYLYSTVILAIDGYNVTLQLEPVSAMKNHIAIYIDNKVKGEWLTEECEERRRFMCKHTKNLFTKSKLINGKKVSKREMKHIEEMLKDPKNKYDVYLPWWTNFNSLKKHLIKNNENIEIVECC